MPEAIGLADVAACLLEVVTLTLAVALLRESTWTTRPNPPAATRPGWPSWPWSRPLLQAWPAPRLSWFQVLVAGMEHSG